MRAGNRLKIGGAYERSTVKSITVRDGDVVVVLADGRKLNLSNHRGYARRECVDLGKVVEVAQGTRHWAALLPDGSVVCWDRWRSWQRTMPVQSSAVVAIAVGGHHTVALLGDGRVVCWGGGAQRQCVVPPDLGPAVAIAAGARSTAALLADGRVRVWGDNCFAVPWEIPDEKVVSFLSENHSLTQAFIRRLVVRIPQGAVRSVAQGASHTVALLSDGRIVCWGDDQDGQCRVPADLGDIVGVAAGSFHNVALRADGRVVCWGRDRERQCSVPSDLGDAVAIAAGGSQSVALLMDGRVVLWGANTDPQPLVVEESWPATAIAAGESHVAIRLSDGRTRVWGSECQSVPWEVSRETVLDLLLANCRHITKRFGDSLLARLSADEVTDRSIGGSHTLALVQGGRVTCWGINYGGQCTVPADLGAAGAVAAGGQHSVALGVDGRVVCWGRNYDGQCDAPADLQHVVAIAAGEKHTAALQGDGRISVWGRACGEVPWALSSLVAADLLVSCTRSLAREYADALVKRIHWRRVKNHVCGGDHVVILLRDGRMACWGDDSSGQCRIPEGVERSVAVAAGDRHTAALLADGRTRIWGSDCNGVPWEIDESQLVDVLLSSSKSITKEFGDRLLSRVAPDSILGRASTQDYSAVLLSNGRVTWWGMLSRGNVPPEFGPVIAIAPGERHMAALQADGRIVCWGCVRDRRCDVPSGLGRAVAIDTGTSHTVALLADGRIACWGRDSNGECAVPEQLQGKASRIFAHGMSTWAMDVDGRLFGWGATDKVDCLPFALTDEAWLEFATRMWGKTKQKIYPEHIRKSPAFRAIRAMHKMAEE